MPLIKNRSGFLKKTAIILGAIGVLLFISYRIFVWYVTAPPPEVDIALAEKMSVVQVSEDLHKIGNSWIKQSESGLFELYVEGDGFERGSIIGKLARDLVVKQEAIFVDQIRQLVPSRWKRSLVHHLIAWYNRNLHRHIRDEYQEEIYGVSLAASDAYNFIGPAYNRLMNYHAAHDIGHALQGFNVVGCTSFATWGSHSADSTLLLGRNFDFQVGDAFSEDKIVLFCAPRQGHKFAMVTWGGMIGTLSGMNEAGLTVTINAAKSTLPTSAATPVSLVAREILQYARNIEEAYEIAHNRNTFVSESFLIGSAEDGIAAVIEKTPTKTALAYPQEEYLICSNHFQSEALKEDPLNSENIATGTSMHRHRRVHALLEQQHPADPESVARVLRDRKGPEGEPVGMGNELAINQLAAHHSVIFQPEHRRMWVSAGPYQLGAYVCYDLNKVFHTYARAMDKKQAITEHDMTIAPDTFLYSEDYRSFQLYKQLKEEIRQAIQAKTPLSDQKLEAFSASNPDYFYVYELLGDYYDMLKDRERASGYYKQALSRRIPNTWDSAAIQDKLTQQQQ